jgi:PKD repeat protein
MADFTVTPISGDTPLSVQFTDISENSISWSWDFGDGATSTIKNPTHIYTVPGTYSPSVTIENGSGYETATKVGLIGASRPGDPVSNPYISHIVNGMFTNWTGGNPTGWTVKPGYSGHSQSSDHKVGTYSLKITGATAEQYRGWIWQSIAAGENYTRVGTWIKIVGLTQGSLVMSLWDGTTETAKTFNKNCDWMWVEWRIPYSTPYVDSEFDIYTQGFLNTGATVYINGLVLSKDYELTMTEADSGTAISKNVTYNPGAVFPNSTILLKYDELDIGCYQTGTCSCTVDGVSKTVSFYPLTCGGQIWLDCSSLSSSSHSIVVTTTYSDVGYYVTDGVLNWKGFTWEGRSGQGAPVFNRWSAYGPYIDYLDRLHLTLKNYKGVWYSSELDGNVHFQYGKFTWVVDWQSLRLDKNSVVGLFTYENDINEFDIEFSTWEGEYTENLWYSNQPAVVNRAEVYPTEKVTCSIDWKPSYCRFRAVSESGVVLADYTDSTNLRDIPQALAMNLWLYDKPSNLAEADIIIYDFSVELYKPIANYNSAVTRNTVQFTDISLNTPSSRLWNFGDRSTSTEPNPIHTYSSPGIYAVSLTVYNSGGSDTITNYVTIFSDGGNTMIYTVPLPTGIAATDTANIQNALTTANGNPGSTVALQAGTYLINATLRVGSNTSFTGPSTAKVKLVDNVGWITQTGPAMISSIVGQVGHHITISGFELDGNEHNQGNGGFAYGDGGGKDLYRMISFQGGSGTNPKADNITVHNMNIHDSKGDGLRIINGSNIFFYNNVCNNLQHCCCMLTAVNTAEMHHNTYGIICCAGDRIDNCQNVSIYNEEMTPYHGATDYTIHTATGDGYTDNAIQIDNNTSYPGILTNVVVHDCILKSGGCAIQINGSSVTSTQSIHIYNNTIHDSGYLNDVTRDSGIGINALSNGTIIEYNNITGCTHAGIIIDTAIGGSTNTITIRNNNITGSVGYGILNRQPSLMSAALTGNYMTGNSSGNYSPSTLAHSNDATSPNGVMPGGSGGDGGGTPGGGGDTGETPGGGTIPIIPTPYIPRSRVVRESLAEYFIDNYQVSEADGSLITGYINKFPLRVQSYVPNTPQTISVNKPAGMDGRNLGIFGFGGSDVSLDIISYSLAEAWAGMASFRARTPAILELGGVYSGWFMTGVLGKPQSAIRKIDGDVPEDIYDYSVLFQTDTPFFKSKTERIRTRHIFENKQEWSSDDSFTGNQLKNNSFESWTSNMNTQVTLYPKLSKIVNFGFATWDGGTSGVAPTGWNLGETGQQRSTDHMQGQYSYLVTGDGTNEYRGTIAQATTLTPGYYTIEAWVKVVGRTQGKLVINLRNYSPFGDSSGIQVSANTTGWEHFEFREYLDFTNPDIRISVNDTANAGSSWYVDAVAVYPDPVTPCQCQEIDNGTSLTQIIEYTPADVYSTATLITKFQTFDIINDDYTWAYTFTTISEQIDGVTVNPINLSNDIITLDVSGLSASPHTITVTINYTLNASGTPIVGVLPDWWTRLSKGQNQDENTALSGAYCLRIDGDGVTADIGGLSQPVSCDATTKYILSGYGAVSGRTQGQLIIEVYSGGTVKTQLIWDADGEFSQKKQIISFPISPTDAVVKVHVTGTANVGSSFFVDSLYFGKASDLEIAAIGNDIRTYGNEYVIPDFEVRAATSSIYSPPGVTYTVGSQVAKTNFNGSTSAADTQVYSSPATAYTDGTSLQLTTTLPKLSNGAKYRIDNISANFAVGGAATASMKVTIQSPSLYSGVETQLVEWTETSVQPAYVAKSLNISNIVSTNEQVIIKYYFKTSNASYRAYAKLLGIKYTPLTPSSGYGDVAGPQTSYTYNSSEVYSSAQTAYNSDGKQWEVTLPALPGKKYRLDNLFCQLAIADSASYEAAIKVTVQSATTYPTETYVMERETTSVQPTYVAKSATITNIKSGVNEALVLRWYLKTSNASHRAYAKAMGYKYTPLIPQTPPTSPEAVSNSVSIYNKDDPNTVLQLCNNLLPACKVNQNGDRTGSFECSLDFSDNTYLSVVALHLLDTYSKSNRTLTLAAGGLLDFIFDFKSPITGIPFIQIGVVSGYPTIKISLSDTDGVNEYEIDANETTSLTNTLIFRELDNIASLRLKGETHIRIQIYAPYGLVMNSFYFYADTISLDAVFPKIYPGKVNTFSALLVGNPVDITIRYRDANLVI